MPEASLSTDRSTVVDRGYHWLPIPTNPPPRGNGKLHLINRKRGVAAHGPWTPGSEWTHWVPLPTFDPEDDHGR